jgi:hypothetical protein
MQTVVTIAIVAALGIGALAASLIWPSLWAFGIRGLFRRWPDAKTSLTGNGRWIKFSRRFGLPYILALFATALVWVSVGAFLIPDTPVGAWVLFGPPIFCTALGSVLGMLRVSRWEVDE